LVLFMAGAEVERIGQALLEAGLSGETPAALIESGSLPEETVRRGSLRELRGLAADRASGPALLIIGRTVGLSDSLRSGRMNGRGRGDAAIAALAKRWEERTERMHGGAG
ncbi:MAG: hypothetical protein HY509_03340, partial [Acidobacteria bacterium]|nr:hypothetical protein [Acidobacteriota bacterium]